MRQSRNFFSSHSLGVALATLLFGLSTFAQPTAEERVIKKLNSVQSSLSGLAPKDDLSCNCQVGTDSNLLSFEDPQVCGEDRNYMAGDLKAFKKVDPKGYFTAGRDYSKTADILPRKCALYIMKSFWKDRALTPDEKREADIEFNRTAAPDKIKEIKDAAEYKPDPHLYSKCDPSSDALPKRYAHKACVTEDYVNVVYNSLIDIADCMDVPAKFIAPKLSNESGLHINAFGGVNDGGIGQFTNQALADVADNYGPYKNKIKTSTKASCKRLSSIPGVFPTPKAHQPTEAELSGLTPREKADAIAEAKGIPSADSKRCHAIGMPPNPLRSLFYYGVFYHATKRNSNNAFVRATDPKNLDFRGAEQLMNDAGIGDFDKEKIKEMLFVMGYNSGPGRPPMMYREWLKYRIETKAKYPITKADFDMNFWPTKPQRQAKLGDDRALALGKGEKPLTFAEYLFAYKDSIYIAAVKAQARVLDKGLGAGTCTSEKFLEL